MAQPPNALDEEEKDEGTGAMTGMINTNGP